MEKVYYSEAKLTAEQFARGSQVEVMFYDPKISDVDCFWMPMAGEGRLSNTYYEYELVKELPKDCNSVAVDGWVERNGTAYYFDSTGELTSAPIISSTYEPDYPNETTVADYMQPQHPEVSAKIMELIC